jgi:hypothetical protein
MTMPISHPIVGFFAIKETYQTTGLGIMPLSVVTERVRYTLEKVV